MGFGLKNRRPAWMYGAIAAVLVAIVTAGWERFDTLSRVELVIPALFWIGAFVIISLRRRTTRS